MPAWEAFEAERPSSSNQSEFPFFMLNTREVMSDCIAAAGFLPRSFAANRGSVLTPLILAGVSQFPWELGRRARQPRLRHVKSNWHIRPSVRAAEAGARHYDNRRPWRSQRRLSAGDRNRSTLDGATLQQAPLSATVVTRDLLNDQVSRLLSDVVKNDASVGNDYVAVATTASTRFAAFLSIWPPGLRSTA